VAAANLLAKSLLLWGNYIIVQHPSIGRPSGNDISPHQQDQSTTGHRQSPTDRRLLQVLSVIIAQTELQMAATPLQWGGAQHWVSRHAGPPPQW